MFEDIQPSSLDSSIYETEDLNVSTNMNDDKNVNAKVSTSTISRRDRSLGNVKHSHIIARQYSKVLRGAQ